MSNSLHKIWVHVVWAIKNRPPYINPEIEALIHDFIVRRLRQEGCFVKTIGGMPDHVHCLFLQTSKKPIAYVIQQVKGSCSRFINVNKLTIIPFSWQKGYAVFSVSRFHIDTVYRYIQNQKTHHSQIKFRKSRKSTGK